ncbi:DNA mismatch repair endonuclease MutL [Haloarcula onubensis]|uniref:DNA mismatch repair protein MutL n=1 Tax=Haloarcula onubensis TaxID=2950539 RepID=A0ABU2FKM6_9EURY|nr:DNA mismatch repair endonuclease MutL [Halomicroarcula sp. S3CR25-11]MDS0280807.1 DNA mismatch repair endonuclease MutL [Halomicroarcula sp. S3CR25-11]
MGETPGTIQQLDERTVERIAAGEVVERPASVVKELVENAIDADADRVTVAVEDGGRGGIRVTDDGVGMDREAVERAVEQHTTSKIRDIEDLEGGVGTLGFRGEALHAIGAVSRVTITTRPRGGEVGTELVVEGGEVTAVGPAGCPEGTSIEIEDLFYNVPARRKYLKQASTEFAHVNTIVTGYALANPDVAVSLSHDGRETFATTGQGDLRETVMSVYGREVAESMIAVDGQDLPDGPLSAVSGLVSHPETTRAGREYLSTYVNGRYVRAKTAHDAVVDAYGTQIAPDRYPFAVLFLDVPAGDVDVNVHPRKMEVRWVKSDAVGRQVRTAVEDALQEEGLLRSSAPRGRSAPEQTEIDPSPVSENTADSAAETADTGGPDDTTGTVNRTDEATQSGGTGQSDSTETSRIDPSPTSTTDTSDTPSTPSQPSSDSTVESSSPSRSKSSTSDSTTSSTPQKRRKQSFTTTEPNTQKTLSGEAAHETTEFDTFPDLRVLGQLHDTYIVAESDDGLILIDQHAADERINYERLKQRFEGETTTQALADPVEIELTAREMSVFEARTDALASLGFHTARTGEEAVEVRTLPGIVADAAGPEIIRDVLLDFVTGEDAAEQTVEAVADELLSDMACYPSITGNTSLTDGSVVDLLSTLDECENPWACPHGRPVLIHIDSDEIGDRFERDYPGH